MTDYFNQILRDITEIADNSRNEFNKRYSNIIQAIENGIVGLNIDIDQFCIYPVGEYDYGTNIEEVSPFKIVLEYSCKKSDIVKRINYLKLKNKKKKSMKDKIMMTSMVEDPNHVYTNTELAQLIQKFLINSKLYASVTIKQNNVFCRIGDIESYDFVIIIAYKFLSENQEQTQNIEESEQKILFRYKYRNYELNYTKYLDNFNRKNELTHGRFYDAIMVYKYMEFQLIVDEKINYKTFTEFNLYEDLLYNVPNQMYVDDIVQTIINCSNYLFNISPEELISIDGNKLVKDKSDKQTYKQYIEYIIADVTQFFKIFSEISEIN